MTAFVFDILLCPPPASPNYVEYLKQAVARARAGLRVDALVAGLGMPALQLPSLESLRRQNPDPSHGLPAAYGPLGSPRGRTASAPGEKEPRLANRRKKKSRIWLCRESNTDLHGLVRPSLGCHNVLFCH